MYYSHSPLRIMSELEKFQGITNRNAARILYTLFGTFIHVYICLRIQIESKEARRGCYTGIDRLTFTRVARDRIQPTKHPAVRLLFSWRSCTFETHDWILKIIFLLRLWIICVDLKYISPSIEFEYIWTSILLDNPFWATQSIRLHHELRNVAKIQYVARATFDLCSFQAILPEAGMNFRLPIFGSGSSLTHIFACLLGCFNQSNLDN